MGGSQETDAPGEEAEAKTSTVERTEEVEQRAKELEAKAEKHATEQLQGLGDPIPHSNLLEFIGHGIYVNAERYGQVMQRMR